MEGALCVPPERSSLIGKNAWKPRYVVLGPNRRTKRPPPLAQGSSSTKLKSKKQSKPASPVDLGSLPPQDCWLSIYKQRGDREPLASYPSTAVLGCSIEDDAVGKDGSIVSTLTITIEIEKPDTKRGDKRQSSRSGSVSSTKTRSKALVFRNAQDDSLSVFDWYDGLRIHTAGLESPSPQLPWAMRDGSRGTGSGSKSGSSSRQGENYLSSRSAPSRSAQRSVRGSFRSSQSANSSRPSSNNRNRDISSPEMEDYPVKKHMHVLDHIRAVSTVPNPVKAAPPPESILDRAFMLNVIPNPDTASEEGPKISSISRFEALMQQSDMRKLDEEASLSDYPEPIPSPAQRALDYIAARPRQAPPTRPPRPTSMAIPQSNRTTFLANTTPNDDERRRSVVSIASSKKGKPMNMADFTKRFSSSSSLLLVRSHTRNGSCESRASDVDSEESWGNKDACLTARPWKGINIQGPAF